MPEEMLDGGYIPTQGETTQDLVLVNEYGQVTGVTVEEQFEDSGRNYISFKIGLIRDMSGSWGRYLIGAQ